MEFVSLYNGITLTVQEKFIKCTKVYKVSNRFCTICKQLDLDLDIKINHV